MFRTKNTPVQITSPDYSEPLSGIVAAAKSYGSLVQLDSSEETRTLIAANGPGKIAILEQDVLTDADWQEHCKKDPRWMKELRKPVPVGSVVSARFAKKAEFEGADFFTGINESSTPGTFLKVAAGKFVEADLAIPDGGGTADIPQAVLVRAITPHDADNVFRWEVEFL